MSLASLLIGLVPLLIAGLALALPLRRRQAADAAAASGVAILEDQLAELARDQERGLIGAAEVRAARLEIERRILKAGVRRTPAAFETSGLGRAVVVVALLAVPAGSAALYWQLGAPSLPDQPFAAREPDRQSPAIPEEFEVMIASLAERLESEPDDLRGWLMLARSRLAVGRPEEAVEPYRKALALAPDEIEAVAGLADALMARAMGVVTPEVQQLMHRLAELEPRDPRPAYYQGLAAAQAGDYHAALDQWRRMLAGAPADAPWRAQVEPSIRQAAQQLGLDPEPVLALSAPPTAQEEAAAAMAALPPEARQAQIRAMVEGLQARLESGGGSAAEWQRLGRARLVLGEREAALAAYRAALGEAPDDPAVMKDLAAALLEEPAQPDGLPAVPDEALALLEQAVAKAPDDPELHWYLGIRALADGELDSVRSHWQAALARLDPATPDWAFVRSRLDALN